MYKSWPPWRRPWAARSTLASQLPFAASSRTPCATSAPRPAARWSPSLPGDFRHLAAVWAPAAALHLPWAPAQWPPLGALLALWTINGPGPCRRQAHLRPGPQLPAGCPPGSPARASGDPPSPRLPGGALPAPPVPARPNDQTTRPPGARAPPGPLPARGSRGPRSASGEGCSPGRCHLDTPPGHQCATLLDPTWHRPRWVSLGRGFHRNVHATTVVPRGDFGPKALGYAPL